MTNPTPAVERVARVQWQRYDTEYEADHVKPSDFYDDARADLTAALDVEELTEVLAREQWNMLPMVASGDMVGWDDASVKGVMQREFRDRVRPFAKAIVRSIVGA